MPATAQHHHRRSASIGLPLSLEKMEGPTTTLLFLGIELDSIQGRVQLPPNKLSGLQQLARTWGQRRKCTKCQLLSLIGKLSIATKVVPADRVFLRQLINASTTVACMHHRISLTKDTRADPGLVAGVSANMAGRHTLPQGSMGASAQSPPLH